MVKFNPPKRKLPFIQIKTKEDILEEIEIFKKQFNIEKNLEDKKEILFRNIFCKGDVLNDDEENKTSYLNQWLEEENAHKETNDKFSKKFVNIVEILIILLEIIS